MLAVTAKGLFPLSQKDDVKDPSPAMLSRGPVSPPLYARGGASTPVPGGGLTSRAGNAAGSTSTPAFGSSSQAHTPLRGATARGGGSSNASSQQRFRGSASSGSNPSLNDQSQGRPVSPRTVLRDTTRASASASVPAAVQRRGATTAPPQSSRRRSPSPPSATQGVMPMFRRSPSPGGGGGAPMSSSSGQRRAPKSSPAPRGRSNSPRSSSKPLCDLGALEATASRWGAPPEPAEVIEARLIDRQKELIREIEADIWSLKCGRPSLDSSESADLPLPTSPATVATAAVVASAVAASASALAAASQVGEDQSATSSAGDAIGTTESTAGSIVADLYNTNFLPSSARSLPKAKMRFLVDNTALRHDTDGLSYRRSKNMDDKVQSSDKSQDLVPWGEYIFGINEGDGWVRVRDYFLPMVMNDKIVLLPEPEVKDPEPLPTGQSSPSVVSVLTKSAFPASTGKSTASSTPSLSLEAPAFGMTSALSYSTGPARIPQMSRGLAASHSAPRIQPAPATTSPIQVQMNPASPRVMTSTVLPATASRSAAGPRYVVQPRAAVA